MRPILNPSKPRTVLLIAALALMFVVLAIIAAGCSGQDPATPSPETNRPALDDQANEPPPPPPAPPQPTVNPPKKPEKSPAKQPRRFSTEEFQRRFLEAMMQEAARRQQQQQNNPRYQEFQRQMERLRQCPRCGGAGSYRYVDQNGVLQARQCPSCLGSGRAY